MDVNYVATPMEAKAVMVKATIQVVQKVMTSTTLVSQVATYSRPLSIGGTSLSAVSPDHTSRKELALAGA